MQLKHPQPLFRRFKMEWILGLAAVASLLLILAPQYLLTRSHVINPSAHSSLLYDDTYAGGDSAARWIDEKNKHWRCTLGQAYKNPYCGMRLILTNEKNEGIDLSKATAMTLWIDYQGTGNNVRIYLRNRDTKHFNPADDLSLKYNMVEVSVADLQAGLTLQMTDFHVADWWIASKNIPLKSAKAEFNEVADLEIQTGSMTVLGEQIIRIRKVEWITPAISELQLYRGVTIFWTLLVFAYLTWRIISMKIALANQQNYQKELIAINKLLSTQSRHFEDMAKTDALTGLSNRVAMREVLYDGLSKWKEQKIAFSMILIDLDHFKQINDTYGHAMGDEILKAIADLLKSSIRKTDFLARWGGEEFVLLCGQTNLAEAILAAESLRKKLCATAIVKDLIVTASFGVASLDGSDLDQLFKSADKALYQAKNNGRNCVRSEMTAVEAAA
ncbi:MAG: hypothetical protein RL497_2952 [Pseudomonadota bacterium]|jgi:diguanylate cyclase (GGDEF)-like protein